MNIDWPTRRRSTLSRKARFLKGETIPPGWRAYTARPRPRVTSRLKSEGRRRS